MKVSKVAAHYKDRATKNQCRNCAHFMPKSSSCEKVSGKIDPNGTSDYFEPKKGSK